MRALTAKITKPLPIGAQLICDDNSGAKVLEIIGKVGYKGTKSKYPSAGICDTVIVSVKKGAPKIRKTIERALVVRQRKEFKRSNGVRIMFEDNAAVLVDEAGLPKGTEIKGVIAREVAERYPKVAAIAAMVV
ncbi:MAG: 50S ribosomal protein L14 [Candidatus Micrarchaeia archaeon]